MITHLEPDILECEVKWALGIIAMNKASEGDGIPVELFQILKYDAVKVLHLIRQQIWKTQQWPSSEGAQPCPTLCDPMDYSLSGSSVHGIFQARVLEWIAISFSRGSFQPRNRTWVSLIAGRRFTIWATMLKNKKWQTISRIGKNTEKLNPSCIVGGRIKWYSHIWKEFDNSLTISHKVTNNFLILYLGDHPR